MPLPPSLKGKFATEPKWLDLRTLRDDADPRHDKFVEPGADFAATIHGMPKEDLFSQEMREQRRALLQARSAIAIMAVLTALAGWQWWEAESAKRAATEQKDIAQTQRDRAVDAERQAIEQKDIAQTQRERAEKNFGIAKKAGDEVVFKLAQNLRDVQGMRVESLRQILNSARTLMDQLARAAPDDLQIQRSRAAMLNEFFTTYITAGDAVSARTATATWPTTSSPVSSPSRYRCAAGTASRSPP